MSTITVAYFRRKSKPSEWAVTSDIAGARLPNRVGWYRHHKVEIDLEEATLAVGSDNKSWIELFERDGYCLLCEATTPRS